MKRTEKQIYDFISEKIAECDRILAHEKPLPKGTTLLEVIAQKEAYHEVLCYIGTVRDSEGQDVFERSIGLFDD